MAQEPLFGLQSDLFPGKLTEDEVQAAQQAGFSFFEIWAMQPHFSLKRAAEADEVRRLLEKFGMSVGSLHVPIDEGWDISSADESLRKGSVERTKLAAERLVALGGDVLVVHPGRPYRPDEDVSIRMRQSELSLKEIADLAEHNGIRVAIENPCPNEVFDNPEELRSMIDRFDTDHVGMCFDSSHANICRDAVETATMFQGRVASVHFSDNGGTNDDHLPPFEGNIRWEELLVVLIEGGFTGPWLFEVLSWGADPYDVLHRASASIQRMRPIIKRFLKKQETGS